MKKFLLASLFVLPACCIVSAQDILAMQAQVKYIKDDTSAVSLLNNLATAFYNNNEYDSCKKYGAMALQLVNKLLNTDAVKNTAYNLQCKKLKAMAVENVESAMMYLNFNYGTDSLKTVLKLWNETGDKAGTASVYARAGERYTWQQDYTNASKHLDTGLQLYKQTGNKHDVGYVYYLIALNERYAGNYGDALENSSNALVISRQIKDTSLTTLALLSNAFLYMYVKEFDEALKNQQEALHIFIAQRDSVGIATIYSDMGNVNRRAGNLNEALKNHYRALAIRKRLKLYSNIGNTYQYISEILQMQGRYNEALSNSIEGLKYSKLTNILSYKLDGYADIGNIYLKLHNPENALKNYDTVLQLSRKGDNRGRQAAALDDIAAIYLSQGKTAEAIAVLNNAATIVSAADFKNLQTIYKSLATAYEKKGDYKNAYESSMKFKQYSDSFASHEKAEKITGITNQLAFENKRALLKASQDKQLAVQQSEIQKQKLMRNITIAGLLAALMLAIIFFIRYSEKKKLTAALEQSLDNLKSAQAQLIQSEKMANLGELTAGISHEIQNPLNFVNNFSEVSKELIDELKNERAKSERDEALEDEIINDIKQNLEKINYHGNRAGSIVKGMLQHARQTKDVKEPTDINALCDECLRLSYHGLRAKDKTFNAEFKTIFDNAVQKINIVPQDIGRVLLNLFNNAFYAMNEKSQQSTVNNPQPLSHIYKPIVLVSTKKINDAIEIKISDNGNGIPQNIIDKIFQPFFTTKPTGQGTGLGLSLAYDIITKEHNGTIKVESKEGEGTTFIINLPIE